jgi:hypothetical protein
MRIGKEQSGNRVAVKTRQGEVYRVDYYIAKQPDETVIYPTKDAMEKGVTQFINGFEKPDSEVYAKLTMAKTINPYGDTDDSSRE